MPNLKDLKNRIRSVKSTQKITKAMQMVAASKLRRAQESAEAARPYAERIERVLGSLASSMVGNEFAPLLLAGTGKDDVHLLVICTSDRGLCGGFNSSIVRAAKSHIQELQAQGKTVKILCVGGKGFDQLKRVYEGLIVDTIIMRAVRNISFTDAKAISDRILHMFDDNEFDVCTLFYNHFKSVMTQILTAQQLIPALIPDPEESTTGDPQSGTAGGAIYEYEPEESEILETLLPRNVSVQILRALLENAASEQGARMTAMDSATRNAGDMIDKLTLNYNRTRQAVITKELIEIISGAEAI
ncbi:MAG TPA: F0F1 ATP synthase subunit gamma [Sneathiellales bacterium]|jgi:F-type H+-transporting ATPase subunit gamma|nr:F0F1 ATP synthase subunit gamma [Sneathiellales bacterium]